MTIRLASRSLKHVTSDELERLVSIWRAQAVAGQVEAREIAQAFATEQRDRLHARSISQSPATVNLERRDAWWKFWLRTSLIVRTANKVLRSRRSQAT